MDIYEPNSRIVLTDRHGLPDELSACLEPAGSPDTRNLLEKVIWGTDGGFQFRYGAQDFSRISDATSLVVRSENAVVGHYSFVPRPWGYLRTLLAVDPEYKHTGLGRWLVREGRRIFMRKLTSNQVLAGTIEADNLASLKLSESVGYQRVAQFEVINYSRFRPKPRLRISRLQKHQYNVFLRELGNRYPHWNDAQQSLRFEECFVWDEGGSIKAGVQAVRRFWQIESLGGPFGKAALKLAPFVRLDMSSYGFASLHFVWGDERFFSELFDSVMAELGVSSLMIAHDPADTRLRDSILRLKKGTLGKIAGQQRAWVTASGPLARPLSFTATNLV